MNRRQPGAIAALLLIASAASADPLTLQDPILPDAAEIATAPAIPAAKATPIQHLPRAGRADVAAPADSIGTLAIKAEDLVAPASRAKQGLTIVRTAVAAVQSLTIDGQVYELATVDQTVDEKFGLRIVTMRVMNVPDSYARFTVAWDGAIVGTLATPTAAYRIASVAPGEQAIYRLPSRDARRLRPAARTDKLERRHVQLEQLAAIAPDMAMSSERGGTLDLVGGRLGKLAPGKVTPATLEPLLQSVSDLAFRSTIPEIRVGHVVRRAAGGRIEFEQAIGGIPVAGENVVRTAPDGTVLALSTSFVDPARAQTHLPILDRSRAIQLAEEAVERHLHKSLSSVELLNAARLYYRAEPFKEELRLEYQFDLGTQADGNWIVTIDAYGGEAVVTDPRMFGTVFGHWVCRDVSSTLHPVRCSDPGTEIVWTAEYLGGSGCPFHNPMEGSNLCNSGETGAAHQALGRADAALAPIHTANPAYCCDLLGGPNPPGQPVDHMIDVNVNSSAWPATRLSYDRATGTIVSGATNVELQNYELVWHELSHHVIHMYNPSIANASSLTMFEGAFNEGMSDTFSAAIAENVATPAIRWGDPWIIGDGSLYPSGSLKRNCKDAGIDFRLLASPQPASTANHARGVAICAFYYRIQRDSNISPRRLLELVLEVIDRIRDYNGDGVDVIDLKGATLASVGGNEALLRNTVLSVFEDMYENISIVPPPLPPNEPPPPGTPAPPFLSSTGFQCALVSGTWSTIWFIDWLPVPQASFYAVYAKSPFRPYPDDVDIVTQTDITVGAAGRDPTGAYTQGVAFGRSCTHLGCGANSNQVPVSMLATCDR